MSLPSCESLFDRLDDRSGGTLQTFKRRLKLYMRYHLHYQSLKDVAEGLRACRLDHAIEVDPWLLLRPLRSYLWLGPTARQRAHFVVAHAQWARQNITADRFNALYMHESIPIFSMPLGEVDDRPHTMHLDLQSGRALGREGSLELHLRLGDITVMRASFSVLPAELVDGNSAADGHVMVIGGLQGSNGGAQTIRELTRLTQRIRTRHLMLTLLQGFSAGWGLVGIRGVTSSAHVYAGYRGLSQRVSVDYDKMWQELGATAPRMNHWVIPPLPVLRSDSEIPSHKRAEHRRRNNFKMDVFNRCCTWARSQGIVTA